MLLYRASKVVNRFDKPRQILMKVIHPTLRLMVALIAIALSFTTNAVSEQVLHSFAGAPDGATPGNGLVADKKGNLYGTVLSGGANGNGAIFELGPPLVAGDSWTETLIYNFGGANSNLTGPYGDLSFDAQGNLYGYSEIGSGPQSAVFELSPPKSKNGAWTLTVLYSGLGYSYGLGEGKLLFDPAGNVYGSISLDGGCYPGNGKPGCGEVFELLKPTTPNGSWNYTVLHYFGEQATDGSYAEDIMFWNGAIYGTTETGGSNNCGTVFELVEQNGVWTENILYSFPGDDGVFPAGGLVYDSAGNLYGMTWLGGGSTKCDKGCGTVFELSPPAIAGDPWQQNTLYRFPGGPTGDNPYGTMVFDQFGNLYGATKIGGPVTKLTNNNGTIFKLSPPAASGDSWTFKVVHAFGGVPTGDGSQPLTDLLLFRGKLYGTTYGGGTTNLGTVFAVVP
jgi:uncharacterized repeat protein (TIGR03803 family)